MAFGLNVFYPGGTEGQYKAVIEAVGDAFKNPPGRIFQAAGGTEHGWVLMSVWESKEDFQRFAQENLGRAHEQAGERGWKSQPLIAEFETYHVLS